MMMEDGWNVDGSAMQEYYVVHPSDQVEQGRAASDVMTRRMKNREHQRRYRARKRLETDSVRRTSTPNGSVADPQENCNIFVDRVRCKRDWKKDARRAHVIKTSEEQYVGSATTRPRVDSMGELPTRRCEDSCALVSIESEKMKAGGRNWKAAARGNINQL